MGILRKWQILFCHISYQINRNNVEFMSFGMFFGVNVVKTGDFPVK